eukprot:8595270-Prorocentrum_lima.AAC.1
MTNLHVPLPGGGLQKTTMEETEFGAALQSGPCSKEEGLPNLRPSCETPFEVRQRRKLRKTACGPYWTP